MPRGGAVGDTQELRGVVGCSIRLILGSIYDEGKMNIHKMCVTCLYKSMPISLWILHSLFLVCFNIRASRGNYSHSSISGIPAPPSPDTERKEMSVSGVSLESSIFTPQSTCNVEPLYQKVA